VALIEDGARVQALLIDQGDADTFQAEQLRPELLSAACEAAGIEPRSAGFPRYFTEGTTQHM
jgi:S-formylglutathione hydrolase